MLDINAKLTTVLLLLLDVRLFCNPEISREIEWDLTSSSLHLTTTDWKSHLVDESIGHSFFVVRCNPSFLEAAVVDRKVRGTGWARPASDAGRSRSLSVPWQVLGEAYLLSVTSGMGGAKALRCRESTLTRVAVSQACELTPR